MYIRGGTGAGNTGVKHQQRVEKENAGSEISKLAILQQWNILWVSLTVLSFPKS